MTNTKLSCIASLEEEAGYYYIRMGFEMSSELKYVIRGLI